MSALAAMAGSEGGSAGAECMARARAAAQLARSPAGASSCAMVDIHFEAEQIWEIDEAVVVALLLTARGTADGDRRRAARRRSLDGRATVGCYAAGQLPTHRLRINLKEQEWPLTASNERS
jgi:hypothetical protein